MPGKPKRNKQIQVDYKIYHELEKEAIESDKTIKEIAESHIRNGDNERIEKLKHEKEELENKAKELRRKIKELEEESESTKEDNEKEEQESNWESIDQEDLVDSLLDLEGVGKQIAWKVAGELLATDWWRIQFNEKIFKEWQG